MSDLPSGRVRCFAQACEKIELVVLQTKRLQYLWSRELADVSMPNLNARMVCSVGLHCQRANLHGSDDIKTSLL